MCGSGWLFGIGFSLASLALAASPSGLPTTAPAAAWKGISEYRLKNGLRVLLIPDAANPTVTLNMTYLVGSRHEGPGEAGMAHLLEHLTFKGTRKHPDMAQELTARGARPNGSTWYDRTNYYATFIASPDNLRWALDLEADRMTGALLRAADLATEKTVVRNEGEISENSPASVLQERALAAAYQWHRYGRSTAGTRSDLEHISLERLQAFYRRHYRPDRAVLVLAGSLDETETLLFVREAFESIPLPAEAVSEPYTEEPPQDGERTVELRRAGDLPLLAMLYHVPAGAHPDFAPLEVLVQALGDSPSGRLHHALVETGEAASTYGYTLQLHDPGVAVFGAEVRRQQPLAAAAETLRQVLDDVAHTPLEEPSIARAQAQLLRQREELLRSPDKLAIELSEWIAMGDWRLFFLHCDRVRQVTPADVARVARLYFKPVNRTIALFRPEAQPDRVPVPPAPDVSALLQGYQSSVPAIRAAHGFDPSPAQLQARLVRRTVAPGLQLVLLPKTTRGQVVYVRLTLRMGDAASLKGQATTASLLADLLLKGTLRRTRQQILDDLERWRARLAVWGRAAGTTVTLEVPREHLTPALELMAEVLRQPSFPAAEFELLRQTELASLDSLRGDPQAAATVALRRALFSYPAGDVRYQRSFVEQQADLESVTLAQVRRFHQALYGASHAEMAVIGDVQPDAVVATVARLFGGWTSPQPYRAVVREPQKIAPAQMELITPDRANAVFAAGLVLPVEEDHPDYPALLMANAMFGGGFLHSRLADRIRQRDGLSYSVESTLSSSLTDRLQQFLVTALCAPQNLPRVEAAFQEELAQVLRDGFTAEELSAAQSGWRQSQQVNRAQEDELARQLVVALHLSRSPQWDAALEQRVLALTAQTVTDTFRRYVKAEAITIVRAGDIGPARPAEAVAGHTTVAAAP